MQISHVLIEEVKTTPNQKILAALLYNDIWHKSKISKTNIIDLLKMVSSSNVFPLEDLVVNLIYIYVIDRA